MPLRINLNAKPRAGSQQYRDAVQQGVQTARGFQDIAASQQAMEHARAEEERRQAEFDLHVKDAERKFVMTELDARLKKQRMQLDEELARRDDTRAQESHDAGQQDTRMKMRMRYQGALDAANAKSAAHRADVQRYLAANMDLPEYDQQHAMQAAEIAMEIEDPDERQAYLARASLQAHKRYDDMRGEEVAARIGDLRSRIAYGDVEGGESPEVGAEIDEILLALKEKRMTWQDASKAESALRASVATANHRRREKAVRIESADQMVGAMRQIGNQAMINTALAVRGLVESEHDTDDDGDGIPDKKKDLAVMFMELLKGEQSLSEAQIRAAASVAGRVAGQKSPRQQAVETLTRSRNGRPPTEEQIQEYLKLIGAPDGGAAGAPAPAGPPDPNAAYQPPGGGSPPDATRGAGLGGQRRQFSPGSIDKILGRRAAGS